MDGFIRRSLRSILDGLGLSASTSRVRSAGHLLDTLVAATGASAPAVKSVGGKLKAVLAAVGVPVGGIPTTERMLQRLMSGLKPALALDSSTGRDLADLVTFTGDGNRTYFDSAGVLRVAPVNRCPVEYDPATGALLGWSIWESRTNLVTNSANPAAGSWVSVGASFTGGIPAPDNTTTAIRVVEDTSTGDHGRRPGLSGVTAGTAYTGTAYIKAGTRHRLRVLMSSGILWAGGINPGAVVNLTTGTIESVNGSGVVARLVPLRDGWFSCSLTATPVSSGNSGPVPLALPEVGASTSYPGDGISYFYLWATQMEIGSFPTPLIITAGSAVTRAAPSAALSGSAFSAIWNPAGGTLLSEAIRGAHDGMTRAVLGVSAGISTNRLLHVVGSGGGMGVYCTPPGAYVVTVPFAANVPWRAASVWVPGSARASVNAGTVSSAPHSMNLAGFSEMTLGDAYSGADQKWNGHIKRATYWPKALPDAALRAITA